MKFITKLFWFPHLHFKQLFSADVTIFKRKLNYFAPENMKKHLQKLLILAPNFFSVLPTSPKPAQNQPKSHFLFHKSSSPCNLSFKITLVSHLKNFCYENQNWANSYLSRWFGYRQTTPWPISIRYHARFLCKLGMKPVTMQL